MIQPRYENEDFSSKALLLLYLDKADKIEYKVGRTRLKNDIQHICSNLFAEDIFVPIDFKPFGKDIYSEQLDEDISWHHSIGLIEIKHGLTYKITSEGEEEVKNPNSVYFTKQEKILGKIEKSIDEVILHKESLNSWKKKL